MKLKDKSIFINNPIYFSNNKATALDIALERFFETFKEYALKYELTVEQIASFKELILDSYLERRTSYFLENKFFNFSQQIDEILTNASNNTQGNNSKYFTNHFYYNYQNRL
jgi:hypothetical protein